MNLNYYNIFYQVAINQNITLTAKQLNISQPSISRAISLLEYELGEQLFIRSKSGVKLTQKGEILFEYISQGICWIRRGENEVAKDKSHNATLLVGASQLTVKSILPKILKEYETNYPDVNLVLQTNSSLKIMKDLKENLLDLAVIPDPVEYDPDIETIKLLSFESILIAGKKYQYLEDKQFSLADLNNYPFITLSTGTAGRRWLDTIYASYSQICYPSIEVPTSDIIIPLVKNDLGLGLVAEIFTRYDLEANNIIKLKLKEQLPKRSFLVCYNKNRTHNEARERFLTLISTMAEKELLRVEKST